MKVTLLPFSLMISTLAARRYKVDVKTRYLTACEKGDTFTVLDCLYLGVNVNIRYRKSG